MRPEIWMISAAALLLAAVVVLWNRRKTRRIMENVNAMLEAAMNGEFAQRRFDESMLSAVEAKLAHYLAASAASARNVQSEKDKIKALISDISHQTKTPIANVLLYAQLLREQQGAPDRRACVDALENQAMKLQSLVDALVKASRLESGVIALHPSRGRLETPILSAIAQLSPRAVEKGIAIDLENADADARFDGKWTEEAIVNLLDNAIKYTHAGGKITIWTTQYDLFSAVHIRDDGDGIPEGEQNKVFQRFYRGSAHHEAEGMGIGLYLVRQIAQGQGGYVKLHSEAGAGSTFSIYLPRS